MNNKKIDLIIPVFNSKKTLFKTLCSVAIQTIKDKITIHIIDDCSTDDYTNILNSFKNELDIIYEKLPKNVGPGTARQYIIDKTNNKYICFLDSDDLLYTPESLEKQYNIMEKGYQLVASLVLNEKRKLTAFTDSDLHGKMFDREFIKSNNIKFPNIRVHEDNAFMNLTIIYKPKTYLIDEISYIYCNNSESITSVSDEKEFERVKILIESIDSVVKITIEDKCDEKEIKEYIFSKTKYLAKLYQKSNENRRKILKKLVEKSVLDEKYLTENDFDKMKKIILSENINKYNKLFE